MGFSMRVSIGVAPVQYGFCKGSMRLADGLQSWSRDSKRVPSGCCRGSSYKGNGRIL